MITTLSPTLTGEDREQLFVDLYQRAFPRVARFVSRRGGTLEEAQDIFQDALLIYYEKVVATPADGPDCRHDVAYLSGIARHRWIKKYHHNTMHLSLEDAEAHSRADEIPPAPSHQRLLRFLSITGKKCMELLRAFYYDQHSLDEVADAFGYSGVRSATVQKYKCLEKVRNIVREKSLQYEDFLEEN